MKILVTGGAGYIGSHTVVELAEAGMVPVIVDDYSNSNPEVLNRLEQITGRRIEHYEADVTDKEALRKIFADVRPEAVIHFAAYKAVGESVTQPLRYYRNNLMAVLAVTEVMAEFDCKHLVYSSSATVYGDPDSVPITEESPLSATNPYGQTKLFGEQILRDLAASDPAWRVTLLRYFNPVGAHKSGLIGEDPADIPNNLMPYISQVASGRLPRLKIFGNDYPTADGTGVRDYVHVVDLARAHVAALEHGEAKPGLAVYNIGTGRGYSVLEVVKAFERAAGKHIAYEVVARRPGDIAACYANADLAERELGWKATKMLDEMCADAWNWQSKNPNGYK
jgi:UDP-glucose 4-epimerase